MAGIVILALAYIVSHFYRSFLAVLSPALSSELGITPAQLSDALGAWFMAFALSQFLVGVMLDKVGPKWTTAALFAVCAGGGGLLFSIAQSFSGIMVAMVLLGIGCAPVLMASVYIFKRSFDARKFAFLASVFIAVGLAGNILGTSPLAFAMQAYGWRSVMQALSALTIVLSVLTLVLVNDPAPNCGQRGYKGRISGHSETARIMAHSATDFLQLRCGWWPSRHLGRAIPRYCSWLVGGGYWCSDFLDGHRYDGWQLCVWTC